MTATPPDPIPVSPPPTVAIVGGGPGGTSLLERLCANAPDLVGGHPLHIHVIDPYPPGPGRVWRRRQSPLLWANSHAADITLFTDELTTCVGPVRPGPSLWEWGRDRAAERSEGRGDPDLAPYADELARITPLWFPSRGLVSAYMAWVFASTVASAPPNVRVHVHRDRAVDVSDTADGSGRQRVELAGGTIVVADTVVFAQGHLDSEPGPDERRLAGYAERHGLTYIPRGYTADQDLDVLRPGEPVIVRGIGLAFVDLMVRVTSDRGGRFVRDADGVLVYQPSGREPVLLTASRRGVPYRSKIGYELTGERPPLPHFLSIDSFADRPGPGALAWNRDLRPALEREMAWAYYHRLFTAHPERTSAGWNAFATEFTALADSGGTPAVSRTGSAAAREELAALVARTVPDPADRLDIARLDRPLAGRRFTDSDALQAAVHTHIAGDLARRADPRHSGDLATIHALLTGFGVVARLLTEGRIAERSLRDEFPDFLGFFSYVASGPPGPRLAEILALARAGIIRFLGEDVAVDVSGNAFAARSPSVPGEVRARALVEARLPGPAASRTRDPLLRVLFARGDVAEESLAGRPSGRVRAKASDQRLIAADDSAHPARFALGHGVAGGFAVSGFARPRIDAPVFRVNDTLARTVLTSLSVVNASATPDPHDASPDPVVTLPEATASAPTGTAGHVASAPGGADRDTTPSAHQVRDVA